MSKTNEESRKSSVHEGKEPKSNSPVNKNINIPEDEDSIRNANPENKIHVNGKIDDDKEPEGVKYSEGKLRYSLLPNSVVRDVVRVLMFGAEKYDDDNWKKVEPWDVEYYESVKRHINLWWDGFKYDGDEIEDEEKRKEALENKDKSGLHHLDHAICCLIFLRWCDERKERTKIGD